MNRVSTLTMIALCSGVAMGGDSLLEDPGFENTSFFPNVFLDWVEFPSPTLSITADEEQPRSGLVAAKLFGQFNGGENATFLTQTVPASPGDLWEASVFAKHINEDPIQGNSIAFIQLAFAGSDPANVIEFTNNNIIDSSTPLDSYEAYSVQAVAPAGAENATFLVGYVQVGFDETGSVFYDDADIAILGSPSSTVQNGSFETQNADGSTYIPGWTPYVPVPTNIFQNTDAPNSGTTALLMFGQFNGDNNDSVIYQDLEVNPGDTVDASVFAFHFDFDALVEGNIAFLNIEWRDAGDNLIDFETVTALTEDSPTDVHLQSTVSGVAPANAVTARIVLGFNQPGFGPGAVHFDDVEVTITPGGVICEGDTNGDNQIDSIDLNTVLGFFGQTSDEGDVTGDGEVNSSDLNLILGFFGTSCE